MICTTCCASGCSVHDLQLLADVNAAEQLLGIQKDGQPTYSVPDIANLPINPYQQDEGQGYAWDKDKERWAFSPCITT